MRLGRHARAARRIDADGLLIEIRLEQQRIGDDADVRAETDQLHGKIRAARRLTDALDQLQ